MTKAARTPDVTKMKAALKAVATELDDATDILHYEDGLPVTTLEGWQIERIFDGLRSVMVQVDEALHERTALKKKAKRLPPDPEAMNNDRAEWAATALRQFQSATGADFEDALADLLGDLMHWADRNVVDFDDELLRARLHYEAETASEESGAQPCCRDRTLTTTGHLIRSYPRTRASTPPIKCSKRRNACVL